MTNDNDKPVYECALCHHPIPTEHNGWNGGHNAWPLAKGRCCGDCNALRVIPERIRRIEGKQPA